MNKARYIKTCYSRKKYEKAEFRKSQWYEYKGYEYFIYPDAYYITGYEVWKQHQQEQDKIDAFFKYLDGEISFEEYEEIRKKNA